MRKFAYMCFAGLLLMACEISSSNNGDFDGFWQMTSVDTLLSVGSRDTRDDLIFWAVQKDLLEMKDTKGHVSKVFFRFSHETDRLIISNPIIDLRDSSDKVLSDTTILYYYGVHRVPDTLAIETLNSSKMTLRTSYFRLHFRKY
ncbi:MAG: lipocalin-like domain-containing protein [Prevotella sp.]